MGSAFELALEVRNAADYADFLLPHLEHDFQTVYFDFPLKANEERVITYTVEYNH